MDLIIIPSYNPKEKLIEIVKELKQNMLNNIVIIDDGSDDKTIFNKLENDCIVLHHTVNKGKGAAIKTGVLYASKYLTNIDFYVFLDGDGQHLIKDVQKVINCAEKSKLITLGVRNLKDSNVPVRSKFGNKFSSIYFKLVTGKKLDDTQTGLRVIPYKYTDLLLKTDGERYEFEMNFLINIANKNISFDQVQIQTVYEDNNKESHFNTITDSIRVYKQPIKFVLSGLSSSIIDLIMFYLFNKITKFVFMSSILARVLSGVYNFNINKYWCFKSYGKNEAKKYFILFITQMLVTSTIMKLISLISNKLIPIKIMVDLIIFIINFIIQKRYIFKGEKNEKEL